MYRLSLIEQLQQPSHTDIPGFEIPTGNPMIYELDGELRPTRRYFLDEKR